jgi:hypothetical protein
MVDSWPAEPEPELDPEGCVWAFDGECDEPGIGTGICEPGTDTTDCGR